MAAKFLNGQYIGYGAIGPTSLARAYMLVIMLWSVVPIPFGIYNVCKYIPMAVVMLTRRSQITNWEKIEMLDVGVACAFGNM